MASYRDKARFYSELRALYDSGIPLGNSLKLIGVKSLKEPLEEIRTSILQNSSSLTRALNNQKRYFSPLEIGLLSMGEQTGRLAACAKNLGDWFELMARAQSELIGSLIYPSIIIHAAPILLGLPELVSEGCYSCYFWNIAHCVLPLYLTFFAFLYLLPIARKGEHPIAYSIDTLLLKIPLLRRAIINLNLARFALSLSHAIDAGVEIHRSLKLAINTTTNLVIRKQLEALSPSIKAGKSLTSALQESAFDEPVAESFVRVGEASGNNVEMLRKVHEYYFERFFTVMQRCSKAFPVIAFLLIALIMGFQIVGSHMTRFKALGDF